MEFINLPLFLIPLLWGLDAISTLLFMTTYKKKYKDNRWMDIEANPIVRFFWKKFGLEKGMLISMVCLMPIIIATSIVVSFDRFFFGVSLGIYYIVFMEHFHAIRFVVKKLKPKDI